MTGRLPVARAMVLSVAATMAAAACASDNPTPAPAPTYQNTLTDFTRTHPEWLTQHHVATRITYPVSPPVGGDHNPYWQNCSGDVYPAAIANEHAVHSLEHGAVWITYRPDLPADQISVLAAKVQDRDFMLMSPYPGLDAPVSVQAWGFQLKTGDVNDPAIDRFIVDHRIITAPEVGAPCSGGVKQTGATPITVK